MSIITNVPARDIRKEAGLAVVKVLTHGTTSNTLHPELNNGFFGASGSGAVIIKDLVNDRAIILTNGHVIKDAMVIAVTHPTWAQKMVHVVPLGVHIGRDIALLILHGASKVLGKQRWNALRSLALANTRTRDVVATGRNAYIIGHPLGYPGQVITTGTIAGLQEFANRIVLETDVSSTHGNSGGPCVMVPLDQKSPLELVGMLSYGIPSAGTTTFIITASEISNVVNLMLGVQNRITTPQAPFVNIEDGFHGLNVEFVAQLGGHLVRFIHPDSPFKDKVQPMDVIVAFNGSPEDPDTVEFVVEWSDLSFNLENMFADTIFGEDVVLDIRRFTFSVSTPQDNTGAIVNKEPRALTISVPWNAYTNLGIRRRFLNLEPNEFETFSGITFSELTLNQLDDEAFADKTKVDRASPQDRAFPKLVVLNIDTIIAASLPTITQGMIIEKINDTKIQSIDAFRRAFIRIPLDADVDLQFSLGSQVLDVRMDMFDSVQRSQRLSELRNTYLTPAMNIQEMRITMAQIADAQQLQIASELTTQPQEKQEKQKKQQTMCLADGCANIIEDTASLYCSRVCRMWSL